MSPYALLGVAVVIFSTAITIIAVLYLAIVGLRSILKADTRSGQTVRELVDRQVEGLAGQ